MGHRGHRECRYGGPPAGCGRTITGSRSSSRGWAGAERRAERAERREKRASVREPRGSVQPFANGSSCGTSGSPSAPSFGPSSLTKGRFGLRITWITGTGFPRLRAGSPDYGEDYGDGLPKRAQMRARGNLARRAPTRRAMPRTARALVAGSVQHVITRFVDREFRLCGANTFGCTNRCSDEVPPGR